MGGDPAFAEALFDEGAEVFVVGVAGAVVAVEARFEGCAGGAGGLVREVYGKVREGGRGYKFWISWRNSRERSASFWAVG